MSGKDNKFKKETSSSPKGEDKAPVKKDKPSTSKLNDPNVPMRRKNKIGNDGKDWFDTHPDA
tara:strand:- start:252 stop:437 length:186 start_codon:yes stop_codon:yes gene_type:complete